MAAAANNTSTGAATSQLKLPRSAAAAGAAAGVAAAGLVASSAAGASAASAPLPATFFLRRNPSVVSAMRPRSIAPQPLQGDSDFAKSGVVGMRVLACVFFFAAASALQTCSSFAPQYACKSLNEACDTAEKDVCITGQCVVEGAAQVNGTCQAALPGFDAVYMSACDANSNKPQCTYADPL